MLQTNVSVPQPDWMMTLVVRSKEAVNLGMGQALPNQGLRQGAVEEMLASNVVKQVTLRIIVQVLPLLVVEEAVDEEDRVEQQVEGGEEVLQRDVVLRKEALLLLITERY